MNFVLGMFDRPPFIVELTATHCVVDLSLFKIGKESLADFVELSSIRIPGRDGLACEAAFQIKTLPSERTLFDVQTRA